MTATTHTSQTVYLHQLGLICALGDSTERVREALLHDQPTATPLTTTDRFTPGRHLHLGLVNSPLPALDEPDNTRTNRLLLGAWQQIQTAVDALSQSLDTLRIGVVIGTSTSGIGEGEAAVVHWHQQGSMPDNFHYASQEMANPAETLARWCGAAGPAYVISTACTSSAKALASARRLLRMGVCDLVIAGGVDSLCQLTVNGFSALESVSAAPCNPFSANRNGINIGEGAALFVLSRDPGPVRLSGVGESSDAHHISAPDPSGAGAARAMQLALRDADLDGAAIDYLNLHGTATPQNDKMESLAVAQVLGTDVPCSSTKPLTGHTLGAAGAIEAAFCWLALTDTSGQRPRHAWDGQRDDELAPIRLVDDTDAGQQQPIQRAMSNSFAFGGNNIALILEREQ